MKNTWWAFRIEEKNGEVFHNPRFRISSQSDAQEFNAGNIGKKDPDGFEWVALLANEDGAL